MEGVSYGSRGSAALVDLAGLNFAIRMTLSGKNIQYNILAPTSIKKFAVGNGSAEKDVMIASWKKLDKNISSIETIKVDDLADSYFIAHYIS
jgi:Holliday junction resolvasome RuvABC endonuclease subunit